MRTMRTKMDAPRSRGGSIGYECSRSNQAGSRAAGVTIGIDGGDLVLEAAVAPPASVIELLARNKEAIVALLRPGGDGWSAEDWRAYYDEWAAILEFDGGLPRPGAGARAFACCVAKWLNNHPASSPPDCCAGCGAPGRDDDPVQPFGDAWLHARCWRAWHTGRKAHATAALKAMGITPAGLRDSIAEASEAEMAK